MLVRWTEPAVRDFTHICNYISEHGSRAAARRVALAIYDAIGTLADFPELGRTGRKPETRELVFAGLPHIAVYRIGQTGRSPQDFAWRAAVAVSDYQCRCSSSTSPTGITHPCATSQTACSN